MTWHQTIIVGRLGSDPELRYLQSGVAVCNFNVAVNERWRDRESGEQRERDYLVSSFSLARTSRDLQYIFESRQPGYGDRQCECPRLHQQQWRGGRVTGFDCARGALHGWARRPGRWRLWRRSAARRLSRRWSAAAWRLSRRRSTGRSRLVSQPSDKVTMKLVNARLVIRAAVLSKTTALRIIQTRVPRPRTISRFSAWQILQLICLAGSPWYLARARAVGGRLLEGWRIVARRWRQLTSISSAPMSPAS